MGIYQVFIYLQLLDLLTSLLGFRMGAVEASPFIRLLMHAGPTAGVMPASECARFDGEAEPKSAVSLRPPEVGTRSPLRFRAGPVGRSVVGDRRAGAPGRCAGVALSSSVSSSKRVGDSGAVGPVQGDGDAGGPVVDPATEVEQVAQDGPVLVGVSEVGVEMLGQPRLAVVGQQPQHHLQAAALDWRAGPGGVRVELGGRDLGRHGAQRRPGLLAGAGGRLDAPVRPG